MIGLRSKHDVHEWRAFDDRSAFGLTDAAGHRDHQTAAGPLGLQGADAPEIGKHLLRRFLADVAGVQDHHVRVVHVIRRTEAVGRQHIRHAIGVVDVHLTAVGLDEQLLGGGASRIGGVFGHSRPVLAVCTPVCKVPGKARF